MADSHTKRGSKSKATKSVTPAWFKDYSYVTHRTNHGDEVRVLCLPNAKNGRHLITAEVYPHDTTRELFNLLDAALYELNGSSDDQ